MFDWGNESNWNSNKREPYMSELVEMVDFSDGDWRTVRLIGPAVLQKSHWIRMYSEKKKKSFSIPKKCLAFDPANPEKPSGNPCPYCDEGLNSSIEVYSNVIDRDIQENPPRKAKPATKYESRPRFFDADKNKTDGKWYLKEAKSGGAYTPVRVLRATSTLGGKIGELKGLNKVKIKGVSKKFGPDHPKYGFDLLLKYDPNAKTAVTAFSVQKGERSALTEEEFDFPLWNIPGHNPETLEVATKELAQMRKRMVDNDGNLLYPDEGSKKGGTGKKKNQFSDNFDEDDDIEDEKPKKKNRRSRDEDDDEEEERPRKSAKSRKSDWDDDDDVDEDDDDEEEDEAPRRSSKTKVKLSAKSRRRDDDDDDEEDERPARRVSSSKKSAKTGIKLKTRRKYDDDLPF